MRTLDWRERKIVAASYSELLLDIEDHLDENEGVIFEVMGNSGIQKSFSKGGEKQNSILTILEKSVLAKVIRFSVGAPFVLVSKKNLLCDVFSLARENGKSICVLTKNMHSELHCKLKPTTPRSGRVKNLFTDSKNKEQLIQFLMSQGIDIVVSDVENELAQELKQVCEESYHKRFLWVQMLNHKKSIHQQKASRVGQGVNWLKESWEVLICAWRVMSYRPFLNQGNR